MTNALHALRSVFATSCDCSYTCASRFYSLSWSAETFWDWRLGVFGSYLVCLAAYLLHEVVHLTVTVSSPLRNHRSTLQLLQSLLGIIICISAVPEFGRETGTSSCPSNTLAIQLAGQVLNGFLLNFIRWSAIDLPGHNPLSQGEGFLTKDDFSVSILSLTKALNTT